MLNMTTVCLHRVHTDTRATVLTLSWYSTVVMLAVNTAHYETVGSSLQSCTTDIVITISDKNCHCVLLYFVIALWTLCVTLI